jgi:hypothetical protein
MKKLSISKFANSHHRKKEIIGYLIIGVAPVAILLG